jgi:DNA-binding transcriptional MocR family regulator
MTNGIDGAEPMQPPLYETVANEIAALIKAGTLRPGQRVPSVRRLSAQREVSISTVLQAYRLLEDRKIIEARPQSGYYVRHPGLRPAEPQRSEPPARPSKVGVSNLVEALLEAGKRPEIVPLGTACAAPELYPAARLQRIVSSLARRKPRLISAYSLPPGNDRLRQALARRALDWGCRLEPGNLIVTSGCTEAVNLCLRAVTEPGDTVALESPTYFGLLQIVESLKLKALEIPTCPRHGLSLDALELAMRSGQVKAAVVMSNASNPLGATLSDENKKRLAGLAATHRVPVIEDNVHGEIYNGTHPPKVAKCYDPDGWILLCGSFSKTLAPGFRIGWVEPGRYRDRVYTHKFVASMAQPELLQEALAEFLESGGYDRHLRTLRTRLAAQVGALSDAVAASFPKETRITRPAGGFVLWIELPEGVDAMTLHREALEHGIGIAPGPMFTASDRYRHCIRLNCGHPLTRPLEQAVMRLGDLVRHQLEATRHKARVPA